MALAKSVFETKLKNIFAMMQDGSKTDAWLAEQIAVAIKEFGVSGKVATIDGGAAPAGVYVGDGDGTMTINDGDLKNKLKTTFESAYSNDDLAVHIATDIDEVCTADDTVTTTSVGTVTTPAGATSPFSGQGKGKFTGTKTIIEAILKTCFLTMNSMSAGGDDYLATQFATAVDSYFKAGTINVTLKAPFISGTGSGGLS